VTLFIGYGCKEEDRLDHINGSSAIPELVTVKEVINREGGAIIKYKVPEDKNLLGVKAVYERNGEICETKASKYTDSLIIEGYGDTNEHDVKLYSVGGNTKLSDPIDVKITPLLSPIWSTDIDIDATFGGVNLFFSENNTNANLSLVLMVDSVGNGDWTLLQVFYTKATTGRFARRGLVNKEQKFAVYIRDRWNNASDTIFKDLTPIAEEKIPKDKFSNAKLPSDTWIAVEDNNPGYSMEMVWEGTESSPPDAGWWSIFATPFTSPLPQHFTINLGHKVMLSRFKMWGRQWEIYTGSLPRTFQVWGTDNPPADGSFDNWQLLGEYEVFKPSGYERDGSVGAVTAEDREYLFSGADYELDTYPTIQYLRFRTLTTFNSHGTGAKSGQVIIAELSFWGQLKD
jgi:hypothetical protein